MKFKKKLLIFCLLAIIAGSIALYHVYKTPFNCPRFFVNRIRYLVKYYSNTEFDVDNMYVSLSQKLIKLKGVKVLGVGREPFLKIDNTIVNLSDKNFMTSLMDLKSSIKNVELSGVIINQTAILSGSTEGRLPIISYIPADKISIRGFEFDSSFGNFDFKQMKANIIKASATAKLNIEIAHDPIGGSGAVNALINLKTENCVASIKWKHPGIQQFLPLAFYARFYGVTIKKGSINVELTWKGNLGDRLYAPQEGLYKLIASEVTGKVIVPDCSLTWAGMPIFINAKAIHVASQPWQITASAKKNNSIIEILADWLGTKNDLSLFKASVSGKNITLTNQAYKSIGMPLLKTTPGVINFTGKIQGAQKIITGEGTANADKWKFNGKKIKTAKIRWELKERAISVKSIFKSELGSAQASIWFYPFGRRKGTGRIEGRINKIDISDLRPFLPNEIKGKCSGPFVAKFNLNNLASTSYRIGLEINDVDVMSFKPKKLMVRVSGKGTDWQFKDPVAIFKDGGQIATKGVFSKDNINLDLMIDKVNLSNFSVPSSIATGSASLIAKIEGSLESPNIKGELWAENCNIFKQPTRTVKAQINMKKNKLLFSPLVIRPNGKSQLDGFIDLNIKTRDVSAFHLNLQTLPAQFLKSFLPEQLKNVKSEGCISGTISFNKRNKLKNWEILLDGYKLTLYDQFLDSVHFEGSMWGNQGEVRHLFVRTFGGTIDVNGQFLSKNKFSGSVDGENLLLKNANFMQKIFPGIKGEVNFQGDIDWDKKERIGNFTVFAKDIKTRSRDLGNLGGEIQINNDGLKIIKGDFDKLGVQVDGNLKWGGREPYNASLKMKNVDLSFIPIAHKIKGFEQGGLIVDGVCKVSGNIASLTPDVVKMNLSALKIRKDNDVIVSNKPVEIIFQNKSVEFRSFELKYRMGVFGIEGTVKPGKEVALILSGKDFSIKALGNLFDAPDWNYDGKLSLKGSLFGKFPNPKLIADFTGTDINIGDKKIPSIVAKVEATPKEVFLEKFQVNLPNNYFVLSGKLGLGLNYTPESINMKLNIPEGPIEDLPSFLPDVFRVASGTIKSEMILTGNPFEPVVSGNFRLAAAKLGFKGMRSPFKDVAFVVSTKNGMLNFDKLHAKLGHGTLDGKGTIDFKDGSGNVKADIVGDKIDLSFLNFDIYRANAMVNVTGNLYNPVVNASVRVPRGKFHITTDMLKERPKVDLFFKTLKYKVDVDIPRNFWLKSSFMNAEMKGKFSIIGDLNKLNLEGGIQSIRGLLYFQRRKFHIDTGEIKFGGIDNKFDPQIYIKSEGQIQNTQVFLTLKGRVSSFTPTIYSSPPMSEGDLLALLTLGRNISDMQGNDAGQAFESEVLDGLKSTYISALIGAPISAALNLDELFLTSLYDRTSGRTKEFIRAGKYIGNNIFIAYEGTLREDDDETYIFEYRLPKGFMVNLEFEKPIDDTRINARYDWKFW